jgi:hypothetical protein
MFDADRNRNWPVTKCLAIAGVFNSSVFSTSGIKSKDEEKCRLLLPGAGEPRLKRQSLRALSRYLALRYAATATGA